MCGKEKNKERGKERGEEEKREEKEKKMGIKSQKKNVRILCVVVSKATISTFVFIEDSFTEQIMWFRSWKSTPSPFLHTSKIFWQSLGYSFWWVDFLILFANLAFWLPWQQIKLRGLDKQYMFGRGPVNNHF